MLDGIDTTTEAAIAEAEEQARILAEGQAIAAEAAKHLDESRFVIAEDSFKTPDMGDFYIGGVDNAYLNLIHEYVAGEKNGEKKVAFYTEIPSILKPGHYPEQGVYCLKGKVDITDDDITLGTIDGDTIEVLLDSIDNGGDESVTSHINQAVSASIKAMDQAAARATGSAKRPDRFKVRLLAIDAPEIPHWAKERGVDPADYSIKELELSVARTYNNHLFVKGVSRPENTVIKFIKMGTTGGWFECKILDADNGKKDIIWLSQDESNPQTYEHGIKARDTVVDLLRKAGNEVHLILDDTVLNRSATQFPRTYGSEMYNSSFLNTLASFADSVLDPNDYRTTGFNLLGQDAYRRFLGAVYVQANGEWINLAKRLIVDCDTIEVNKDFRDMPIYTDHNGMVSDVFNLDSHNYNEKIWADAVWNADKQFDDRRKIQEKIFGTTFEVLKDWTVTIGDTTLFVPPTSIRCITQTTSERMPLIRAKGTMTKSAEKSERFIQLSLYFNDERGINGYEYTTTTSKGQEIKYWMNGLRALIAQFKFTPFLPIDSDYINSVLNIEAVTLVDMKVSTVPGYPKLLQATLTMQEFNYRVYMPEIPIQETDDSEYRNYFAGCINFKTMRYYYQRSIKAGQDLAAKGLAFNSPEYIKETLINTALLPMKFQNPKIKFYIANETYLKQMLQTKIEAMRRTDAMIVLSQVEKQAAADIVFIYNKVISMLDDAQFTAPLAELNTVATGTVIGATPWHSMFPLTAVAKNDITNSKLLPLEIIDSSKNRYAAMDAIKLQNKMNDLLHRMRQYMNSVNADAGKVIIKNIDLMYKEEDVDDKSDVSGDKKGKISFGILIETQLDYLSNDEMFADMRREASAFINESTDKFFQERKLFIPVAINVQRAVVNNIEIDSYDNAETATPGMSSYYVDSGKKFYFDSNHPDVKFLGYCHNIATAKEDPNAANLARKQAIDIEQLNSIVFDPYDVGECRVTSMDVSFGNNFAKIGVTSMDGFAPQYMGGQDTTINIQIQTTSQKTAAALNALPRLSAFYAREYRLILQCWPLKLESELTAFFGVNETLIENVVVDTVPGMPDLYQINMTLVSVDRTLRNREALKRIEANNAGYQGVEVRSQTSVRNYFELQNQLAQANIYPDLELPTIKELSDNGFEFLRYKFQDNRVYPDPDFYFIYPHVLTSQILRDSILASIKDNFDDITWIDKAGGEISTKVTPGAGIDEYKTNKVAKDQKTAVRAMNEAKAKQLADNQFPDNAKAKNNDLLNVLNASETQESWDICKDIKCMFLEKKYQMELDAYKNWQKAQSAIKDVDTKAITTSKPPEGQWAYDSTAKAREASDLIDKYLNGTVINENNDTVYRSPNYDAKTDIVTTIKKYLVDDKICEIMYYLNIENTGKFQNIVAEIVYAAACSATAKKEYANKSFDNSWRPDAKFIGVRLGGAQDKGGKDITNDLQDAIENAIEFGIFRIKQYTKEEIIKITGEDIKDMFVDYPNTINSRRYLLDPYYRRAETTLEDITNYKKGCINSVKFSAVAFFRLILYWLKQLIDSSAIPTITTDILRLAAKNELNTIKTINTYIPNTSGSLDKHVNFFLKNSHAIDSGKFFAAATLALTSGDSKIKDRIQKRDYKGLNGYIQGVSMPSNNIDTSDGTSLALRKMILALAGLKWIQNLAIGVSPVNPATEFLQDNNEKMYLKAAEDPEQYILHSFHDMTVNNARGRMLKAFPVFYMLFIDEGRDIGIWKLHDNLYNTSAIAEIQIAKSRKLAADTARIVMSNMYNTYTTEDEDANINYNSDWGNVVDSIFSPRMYAIREEIKRSKTPMANRIRLRSGARIHIRMGYGSNAAHLPVVFNGCIAEVQSGGAIELIAQGDGIELMNPILENEEAHSIQYKDSLRGLFTNGATPKTILNAILTVKGGILNDLMHDTKYAHLLGRNPYGIYHFGDPDNNRIFRGGETIQNIYEAMSRPVWGTDDSVTASYATDEAPKISFEVFGKTIWDMLHICKSVSPDFIAAVAPFGFRSTIFHGAPRYYYAYDYWHKDGVILEKRKPYQQYHIYSSFNDIIKNNITASDTDVKTCAIGLYEMAETGNIKNQKRIGPLWADVEIFPENQRTMIVDTQLYGKGIPIVGFLIANSITSRLTNWFADDSGDWGLISHDKVCWRMTASALKDSMKDMYQGDLIVMGDPAVKPHDRMFINDAYENMTGQCLVKEVVHNFSAITGYTTSIYPDVIAVVDDRHELVVQSACNALFSIQSLATGMLVWASSMAFGGPAATLGKSLDYIGSKAKRGLLRGAMAADSAGVTGAIPKMKTGIRAVQSVLPAGRAVAAAGSIAGAVGGAAICSAILLNAVIIGTTIVVGNYVTESISRWAKNLQVLQVFPLKKHGLAMTAGINGNQGLVYGTPNYNDPGLIKGLFATLTTGKFNNWTDPILEFCQDWVISDEWKNIGAKYRRDGGIINDKGNPIADEKMFTKTLKAVASSRGEITSGYRASQLIPRATLSNTAEVRKSYDYYAMLDTTRVQADPKLQRNQLISADTRLWSHIENKFFQIIHEQENLNSSKTVKPMTLTLNGQSVNTKAIAGTNKDHSIIYDLPFLNKDCLNFLCEIINRTKSKMPSTDASDQHQAFEDTKGSFVVLKSALRVGDKDTFSSTGFSFILQGMKDASKPLASAIKELQTEIAEEAKTNPLLPTEMFRSEVKDNNEIAITILLPSVS